MNKILVVGSINLDLVFAVDDMVRKGETIHSHRMDQFLGGKGFNQAIALRRAYPEVHLAVNHAQQDSYLVDAARAEGLNTDHMLALDKPTGMAFIQVNQAGDNCIVLNAGANGAFTRERFEAILSAFGPGDLLVLQNEINELKLLITLAKARGLSVALNPSPFTSAIKDLPLEALDYLVLNEIEGEALAGVAAPSAILETLKARFPKTCVVLTLGAEGVLAQADDRPLQLSAIPIKVVDTTAAGDTFLGYFLGAMQAQSTLREALTRANYAAALCCTRPGASNSIPRPDELEAFIQKQSA